MRVWYPGQGYGHGKVWRTGSTSPDNDQPWSSSPEPPQRQRPSREGCRTVRVPPSGGRPHRRHRIEQAGKARVAVGEGLAQLERVGGVGRAVEEY